MSSEFGIALTIAVFVVAQQRVAGERCVHADLMRASRGNVHFHQRREWTQELHRLEYAHRVLTGRRHAHMPLTMLAGVGRPPRLDSLWPPLAAARQPSPQ